MPGPGPLDEDLSSFEKLVRERLGGALRREMPDLSEQEIRNDRQPILAAQIANRLRRAVEVSEEKLRLEPEDALVVTRRWRDEIGRFPLTIHWEGRRLARSLTFEVDRATGMIRWTRETERQEPKSGEIDPKASMDPTDVSITLLEVLVYDFISGTTHE